MRQRRESKGLQQAELAYLLGQSPKHIRAYESGHKAVSLPRLYRIACALDVPVGYFFDDFPSAPPAPPPERPAAVSRDALPILRAFLSLNRPQLRQQALVNLLSLAEDDQAP